MKNERLKMNKNIFNKIKRTKAILIVAAVIVAIIVLWWVVRGVQQTEVSLEADQHIDITPHQIESIRAIGQWEFLSISNEELIDTVRKGIFRDDHLARIYYGTVRLGIDMQQMDSTWITVQGDSITLWLPRPTLLDKDFIDEARTKSFHESGRWTAQDRETMYRRAQQRMLRYSLTRKNVETAQQNGETQMRRLMQSMGYQHVNVEWR
jgi:2-polyprenyl-3-methyl-5-hydroxy-6-metoxy-1,4-benzoquinol methylase